MTAANDVREATAVDLGALLDSGDGAVVTLVAGDTRLVAHRAVLAARSSVFEAMFRHNTLEASSGVVNIPDVEGPVLRQLLAYLYTLQAPQAPQLPSIAPQLLAAADKYGLSGLRDVCEQLMVARLAVENAAATAILAVRHSCPSLTAAAVAFIKAHHFQVVASQGWADAVRTQPEEVIELTRLLAGPSPKTSTAATEESSPTAGIQPRGDHGQTSATATSHTLPPDDAAVTRMRILSQDEKNRRLLQAAKNGAVQDLQALLAAGADVGTRDGFRQIPLHWAAFWGHVEAVRCLLDGGSDVGARNSDQNTPLHSAARNDHAAVVRLLAAASADLDAKNVDGWTPLHRAAFYGKAEAAAALLEVGADREARDDSGATARHLAKQKHHQQVVQLLT